jgi:large subunit ribosomal protein L22
MEVSATARYMRIAPRKARLVAATVVGLPVKDALTVLEFMPRAAAKEVAKVVKSAAANATNNFNQDEDDLVVKSIVVNEGPTLKRGQARARGMFFSIFKRTCHIIAVVDAVEREPRRRARGAAAAPTTRAAGKARAARASAAAPEAEKPAKQDKKAESKTADKADKKAAKATAEKKEAKTEEKAVEAAAEEQRAVEAETDAGNAAEEDA